MARRSSRIRPQRQAILEPLRQTCPDCAHTLHHDYNNQRTVLTLAGPLRVRLKIARCHNPACPRFARPYRPETEGRLALPQHEAGLDVIALVGALRHREHRSLPEIHHHLQGRGVDLCPRSMPNLLQRYDELVATSLADPARLARLLGPQRRLILALDGLQPHKGHEVLWVVRETLSGQVLLARAMLSARVEDLAALLGEVKRAIEALAPGAPEVVALVSDGQTTIRSAAAQVLPQVPHQLCQFHFLREAARPAFEADRAAKKELKKHVRGVRELERAVEQDGSDKGVVVRGYCAAVRASLDDEGQPPLDAPGLKLKRRLGQIEQSLAEAGKKGGTCPRN